MTALRPIPSLLFGSDSPEPLPRPTPGETPIPLWWATSVSDWTTDVDGSRGRLHDWIYAVTATEPLEITVTALEVISADGVRQVDPDVGIAVNKRELADAYTAEDLAAFAAAFTAAGEVLARMAERGVEGVAR